jgi:cytoskeleton protein RodZ
MTDLLSPGTEDLTDTAERPAVAEPAGERPPWTHVPDEPEADEVVVRRNGRVSVALAAVSAVLAAAYFARAVTSFGHYLDWILFVGLTALTWAHVFSFLDSRMPLLVADSHGVRIRLGRTWRGMAWEDLEEVEYVPRRHLVRDGRLVLFPRNVDRELAMPGRAPPRAAHRADVRLSVRHAARADHPGAGRPP